MSLFFISAIPLKSAFQNGNAQLCKEKWMACATVSSKRSRLKRSPPSNALPSLDVHVLDPVARLYVPSQTAYSRVGVFQDRVEPLKRIVVAPKHSDSLSKNKLPKRADGLVRRRKPHGYWNQLENVERELLFVNEQLGNRGRVIPRITELKALGRGDLVAALMKHGGVKHVAVALRWTRAPSGCARRMRPTREKVLRRPADYWQDAERVYSEMSAFIEEFGSRGVMPTRKQLYSFGRADLANAAMKHGGLRAVAKQMNLKGRRDARSRGYWRDFSAVYDELLKFSGKYCPGVMPTADELSSKGLSCLVNAIASHGGFPSVAEKCGLMPRNVKRQGAPAVWDEIRLRREYLSFLMTFYPQLAKERIMVGERQLRKYGRNDISYAIGKFGGFARLANELGFRKRTFKGLPLGKSDGKSR